MPVNRLKGSVAPASDPLDPSAADGSLESLPPPALQMKSPASFCGLLIRVEDEGRQRELYERLRAEGASCRLVNW